MGHDKYERDFNQRGTLPYGDYITPDYFGIEILSDGVPGIQGAASNQIGDVDGMKYALLSGFAVTYVTSTTTASITAGRAWLDGALTEISADTLTAQVNDYVYVDTIGSFAADASLSNIDGMLLGQVLTGDTFTDIRNGRSVVGSELVQENSEHQIFHNQVDIYGDLDINDQDLQNVNTIDIVTGNIYNLNVSGIANVATGNITTLNTSDINSTGVIAIDATTSINLTTPTIDINGDINIIGDSTFAGNLMPSGTTREIGTVIIPWDRIIGNNIGGTNGSFSSILYGNEIQVGNYIRPDTNNGADIGTTSLYFNNAYITTLNNTTTANITTANITTDNTTTANITTSNITTANITTGNITNAITETSTITQATLNSTEGGYGGEIAIEYCYDTLSFGDLLEFDAAGYYVKSTYSSSKPATAIYADSTSNSGGPNTRTILYNGFINVDFTGGSQGAIAYRGNGDITSTIPSTSGQYVQIVGTAMQKNSNIARINFRPSTTVILRE